MLRRPAIGTRARALVKGDLLGAGHGGRRPSRCRRRQSYAQPPEMPEWCRPATSRPRLRASAATHPIAPQASEEVDDQIDANAEEGSHGTCQCHDQKGLVDHYTTPHHIDATKPDQPLAPAQRTWSPSDQSDSRIVQNTHKCTLFAAVRGPSEFRIATCRGRPMPPRWVVSRRAGLR